MTFALGFIGCGDKAESPLIMTGGYTEGGRGAIQLITTSGKLRSLSPGEVELKIFRKHIVLTDSSKNEFRFKIPGNATASNNPKESAFEFDAVEIEQSLTLNGTRQEIVVDQKFITVTERCVLGSDIVPTTECGIDAYGDISCHTGIKSETIYGETTKVLRGETFHYEINAQFKSLTSAELLGYLQVKTPNFYRELLDHTEVACH